MLGSEPLSPLATDAPRLERSLMRLLSSSKLPLYLALCAFVLSSSALFMGYYLDDYVGRYIFFSPHPDAARLYRVISAGYGIANGNPKDTLWQIEQGYAPWYTDPELLLILWRPIGVLSHWADVWLLGDNPLRMHLHNLLWLMLAVVFVTRAQRRLLGPVVGGLAGLLFAFDHTHGFIAGYIANRHSLLAVVFGFAALELFVRARQEHQRFPMIAALGLYLLALLSSEASVAIAAYLFAYVIFVEQGPLVRRLMGILPFALITLVWRTVYSMLGYGSKGSGLYIDPISTPLLYLDRLTESVPLLLLGQYFAPPAEFYSLSDHNTQRAILLGAIVFLVLLAVALWPVLTRYRLARFYLAGMLLSLIPAASTYPQNRLLIFSSFGAMALLALCWRLFSQELRKKKLPIRISLAKGIGALLLFFHLVISPLLLPLTTLSIAFTAPLSHAAAQIGDELAGHEAVFLTAPDYFSVKLVQLMRRTENRPLPKRCHVLSFGPQPITVYRTDSHTLELEFHGGLLSTPFMELYRSRVNGMQPGQVVSLDGMKIKVLEVTKAEPISANDSSNEETNRVQSLTSTDSKDTGRPTRARFRFEHNLDESLFVFYKWQDTEFVRLKLPEVSEKIEISGAKMPIAQ